MVARLQPDLVTMDIHMPRMDGLEATEQIMAFTPDADPRRVVLGARRGHGPRVRRARRSARSRSSRSPSRATGPTSSASAREVIRKVKVLANVRVITHIRAAPRPRGASTGARRRRRADGAQHRRDRLVDRRALGAAHGARRAARGPAGPRASSRSTSPTGSCPVSSSWLDAGCAIDGRRRPRTGSALEPGVVYFAPTGANLVVDGERAPARRAAPPGSSTCPRADTLFDSVARVASASARSACSSPAWAPTAPRASSACATRARRRSRRTRRRATVFGMPKAAIEAGAADRVLAHGGDRTGRRRAARRAALRTRSARLGHQAYRNPHRRIARCLHMRGSFMRIHVRRVGLKTRSFGNRRYHPYVARDDVALRPAMDRCGRDDCRRGEGAWRLASTCPDAGGACRRNRRPRCRGVGCARTRSRRTRLRRLLRSRGTHRPNRRRRAGTVARCRRARRATRTSTTRSASRRHFLRDRIVEAGVNPNRVVIANLLEQVALAHPDGPDGRDREGARRSSTWPRCARSMAPTWSSRRLRAQALGARSRRALAEGLVAAQRLLQLGYSVVIADREAGCRRTRARRTLCGRPPASSSATRRTSRRRVHRIVDARRLARRLSSVAVERPAASATATKSAASCSPSPRAPSGSRSCAATSRSTSTTRAVLARSTRRRIPPRRSTPASWSFQPPTRRGPGTIVCADRVAAADAAALALVLRLSARDRYALRTTSRTSTRRCAAAARRA